MGEKKAKNKIKYEGRFLTAEEEWQEKQLRQKDGQNTKRLWFNTLQTTEAFKLRLDALSALSFHTLEKERNLACFTDAHGKRPLTKFFSFFF